MNMCISAIELRKALADIEAAEKNGFHYCIAVFRLSSAGNTLSECRMTYSDMIERAHPTDGRFDWGRFKGVTKRHKFSGGKLIPINQRSRKSGA